MKHSVPMGIGPLGFVHVGDGDATVDVNVGAGLAVRFAFLAAGGGAPGQPQVSGKSRHSKVIHCPALGPLVKHSSPIGIIP